MQSSTFEDSLELQRSHAPRILPSQGEQDRLKAMHGDPCEILALEREAARDEKNCRSKGHSVGVSGQARPGVRTRTLDRDPTGDGPGASTARWAVTETGSGARPCRLFVAGASVPN